MINKTEIWVYINEDWKLLDTMEESMSLNYSLADITDIGTRNSSFSKTITLPETINNRAAFEYISDLSVDSLFNQNKKSPCKVIVDGLTVFSGNIQLKKVIPNYVGNDPKYEVVIYNDNDTFLVNIGEKYLGDLNISYLSHTWSYYNAQQSWYADWKNGYYYPLIDYGTNYWESTIMANPPYDSKSGGVQMSDFYPAVYAKTILNQIMRDAGYNYKSNFFDSPYFESLIIPFNNAEDLYQDDSVYDNNFRVEYSSTPGYYEQNPVSGNQYRINYSNELVNGNNVYQAGPTYAYIQPTTKYAVAFGAEFIANVLVGATLSQVGNFYTASNGTNLFDGEVFLTFRRDKWGGNGNIPINGGTFSTINYVFESIAKWSWYQDTITASYLYPEVDSSYPGLDWEFVFNSTTKQLTFSYSLNIQTDLLDNSTPDGQDFFAHQMLIPGEKVDSIFKYVYNQNVPSWAGFLFPSTGGKLQISSESSFYNIISSQLVPGGVMNMNAWLPKKFKQKDFIKGLISMFNLIIDIDPTNNKILIIEPWNDYYGSGDTQDWTSKIDLKSVEADFISDFQSKKNIFSYKDDSDYINKTYKDSTTETYGQEIFEFDNDFIKDEKRIETTFSPTPIISLNNPSNIEGTFPISRFSQTVTGGKQGVNLRILFANWIPLQGNIAFWTLIDEDGNRQNQGDIPYAGHLDNPYSPTEDLNYGQVYTSSFNWTAVRKTLYYKYWKDYVELINSQTSRIVTADFYLTPTDIANFRFKNYILISINGVISRYIVNKISNYNPSQIGLTKVELIKI